MPDRVRLLAIFVVPPPLPSEMLRFVEVVAPVYCKVAPLEIAKLPVPNEEETPTSRSAAPLSVPPAMLFRPE